MARNQTVHARWNFIVQLYGGNRIPGEGCDKIQDAMKIALLVISAICVRAADVEWPINGGPYNIRYSTLTQINTANVNKLQVAWSYDAHDAFKDSEMQSNPIVVDGVLYATTPKMRVIALDAQTGREIWSFDPNQGGGAQRRYHQRG